MTQRRILQSMLVQVMAALAVAFLFGALAINAQVPSPPTILPFDVPGAQGTQPQAINAGGTVTGYYYDASFVIRGFLRAPDGTFTTFAAPGATSVSGQGTIPFSIN